MKIYGMYEEVNNLYAVVEFLQGPTLMGYVLNNPDSAITEKFVANIMRQLLQGLNHMHSSDVMHRDIKLENLMFADVECKTLKLAEFSLVSVVDPASKSSEEILGSPVYAAPELLCGKEYTPGCDIWSSGIVCYTLLAGTVPYEVKKGTTKSQLFDMIKMQEFSLSSFRGPNWKGVSQEAKNFMLLMLQKRPEARKTAEQLLQDPWLKAPKETTKSEEDMKKCIEGLFKITSQNDMQQAVMVYLAQNAEFKLQAEQLAKTFTHIDKNGDHKLTRQELQAGIAQCGITISDEDFDQLFNKLDVGKSGTINFTEYVAGSLNLSVLSNDKFLQDAFNFFDKDKNGFLDKGEITTAFGTGWISDEKVVQLFEEVDTSKDGKISFAEFKQMMTKLAENPPPNTKI